MPETTLNFTDLQGVVADMDGVLWRGDQALPGMADFFAFLRGREIPFVLASNNSSRSQSDYTAKLAKMGIADIQIDQIVTSGTTTVDYLRTTYSPSTRLHVLGGDGLKRMIADAGLQMVDHDAEVVVAGIDFDLTYERLKRAALQIRAGAVFIGTNDDATFPSTEGLVPGAGSILAALKTATEREPIVMGKPGLAMFHTSLRVLGTQAGRTLMIGDRINTDIEGAQAAGLKTALVLSGVTTVEELAVSAIQPDAVFDHLAALVAAWDSALGGAKSAL
jgi:4-nitrophenyl phosphatase